MPPLNFTLHYDDRTNDIDDTTGDVDDVAVCGRVRLTPVFDEGARVPAPFYSPRPTGFAMRVFTGWLDSDGRLKNTPGGTAGMRVWANDPDFEIDRLQYLVEAKLVDSLGRPVPFASFYIDAPSTDIVRYLALDMPVPGQDFRRGRPAYDITELTVNANNQFVFEREDGYKLGPVSANVSAHVLPTAHGRAVALAIALD